MSFTPPSGKTTSPRLKAIITTKETSHHTDRLRIKPVVFCTHHGHRDMFESSVTKRVVKSQLCTKTFFQINSKRVECVKRVVVKFKRFKDITDSIWYSISPKYVGIVVGKPGLQRGLKVMGSGWESEGRDLNPGTSRQPLIPDCLKGKYSQPNDFICKA